MHKMLVLAIENILAAPCAEGASEKHLGGFEPGEQKYPTFKFPNSLILKYFEIFELNTFQNFHKFPNSVILSVSQNARIH